METNKVPHILFKICISILLLAHFIFFMGCATMIDGSQYMYSFTSEPSGALVTVYRGNQNQVHRMRTPFEVQVHTAHHHYIKVELPGYKTEYINLKRELNPLTCLSASLFLFPAIVDFVSGSDMQPAGEPDIHIKLKRETSSRNPKMKDLTCRFN